jgi:hypothetical protein
MKEKEYINKLFHDEDDMEGGLLANLEISIPKEVHKNIVKSIKQNNNVLRSYRFKSFVPLAAAILAFVLCLSSISDIMLFKKQKQNNIITY